MRRPSCSPYLSRRLRSLREVFLAKHRGEAALHALCLQENLPGDGSETRGGSRSPFDAEPEDVSQGRAPLNHPDPGAEARRSHSRDAPPAKRASQA